MEILLQPDSLSLVGSMNRFEVYATSDVSFVLQEPSSGKTIVQHTYTPNNQHRISLQLKDVISPLLSFKVSDSSSPYEQPNIMKTYKVTFSEKDSGSTKSVSFSVLRAGVDQLSDSASNFLKTNFLTWQPSVKPVTYYSPEFLTYYAQESCVVKCKLYIWNGVGYEDAEVSLAMLNAGKVWTIPVQYAIIAKNSTNGDLPSYYDIWVEGTDGTRFTYVQRYYASDMKSEEEEWFLFENSLGGIDCFRAYGDSENTAEHTHNVTEIEEDSEEYRVDTTRKFKKNTGYLDDRERLWLLDFFPSLGKYLYTAHAIRKITVTESDVNYNAKELPSDYTFTYKYADARPYLNLSRTDVKLTEMAIHVPVIGNFTIAPRLVEFPRQTLSGGALFPIQDPYSEEWGTTTLDAIYHQMIATMSDSYSGGGGIGHVHGNYDLLNSLMTFEGYLLMEEEKIKAGYADQADDFTPDGKASKRILRKDIDDKAEGVITFLKGLKVGNTGNYEITADGLARLFAFMTANFNSGLYGQGASIDDKGAAELDSLFVRKFISTPKFVFNEISVTKAEQWNTNGFGTIESVDTTTRQITLKLEENDYGSLSEGDICRGIYADIDNSYGSDSIEEGALDDCNFVTHKGFFTTYFYVRRIITAEKGKFVFEYGKRNRNTPDPCAFMDFAQYGSFTDSDRMSSMYFCSRGRSYIEVLDGVKTWEVQVENRVARYGYLGNLRVKRKDGTYIDLKGNGLFAQNNVYFGDNIFRLENISNLDELENLAASYDVTLSQYQSVLTIDDMGNVINGLYTEDEGKTTKQYRVSTAVFVRKGNNILLEEDESNEDVTEGHYRLHVVSAECTCEVQNSTVFVTAIKNVKDGVVGTADDTDFDYDAMRKMTDCMVTIVVDLEGKTSKVVQMPIRIQHDSLPFMVCDLTNEHASVSWHTKHKHYAGLPIETTVNMFYKNEPYEFGMRASLPKEVSDYLEVSVSDSGKSKVLTIDKKAEFSSDVLPTSFEVGIYCVSDYAGAKYEYTKKLSVSKTADAVIYEIVPSANSVSVNSKNEVSPSSVGCEVWATSSDDKRYQVTALPDGYSLAYQKDGGTLYAMQLSAKIAVAATDKEIAFVLKHTENGVSYVDDKEGVPVVKDGKGGMMALCSDNMVSVSVDVNGKVAAALNSSLSFRLFAGEKELTVSGISINASPTSKVVTATVSGNTLNLSCDVGADFGKYDMSYIIKVDGKDGSVDYSSYVSVKIVPNVLGKGMVSVNTFYALGDSATDKPADSAFTYDTMGAAVIKSNADKYLWSGDKITYSDRSTAFTGIYLVGKCSELASVTEQYAKTTTAAQPTDGWADTYPSPVAKGDYIWSRDKITWKNGSVSYSAAQLAGYIGKDGNGYEYVYCLASENKTPDKPSRRAEATLTGGWTDSIPSMDSNHGYIFVSCRQGEPFAESSQDEWSPPVLYARLPKQIDSVNTWYGLSSSITTLPSSYSYDKMSDAVIKDNADKYLWSADKVTYTDGTSEFTGAYCVGKCSELASIKEQYGTSTSSTTKPTSWSDSYPTNLSKGTYIWTRDYITWKNGGTDQTDAQLAGYIGTDGAGQVVAYKRAATMPNYTPSVTDYDTYKGTDDLGSGWTKSAPSSDDSLVSGGSVSSVSANNNTNGGTWSSVADGGYNWYKSPSVADNGIATMRIYFATSVANQYVTFYLRAYSENNYDFVLISAIDSTSLTRDSGYTARVSGNGNDTYIRLKCSTAGQHFVTVAYAKDVSGSSNGDYGLVRMATTENYISQSSILYRCDGSVIANVISWGSIYQAQGDKGDNGDKGDQGVGISSVTTYYLISSLSSGVSTSTSGWTTSMVNPTSSKPYLWSYTKTTLSDGSEENSTPVIIGNFAEAGPMGTNGCIVRNSIWKSGVEYRNDSALTTDGVKYLDYVYVENSSANDGWDKYVCNTTHTSASYNGPTSSYGYWTKLSDAGPIYSPLIVAKNAAINFAQGQQFNLVSSNSIFGSFRIPGSDGYALWLGGSSASDASFKVDKDGKMVASDAEITGKITADSGSIGGVTITQSWLGSGVIELGNEYYTGAILSNKGLFTGYKNCYFGAGGFAESNPKGEWNKMYEMDGTSNTGGNMSAPAAYIRKYTPENSILNNIDKPYGAALIVDVPRGVGITSYGANIFGSLALGALASSSSIDSTNTFFQRNRASVAVLTSGGNFYLPSSPQQGQIVIVIHAGGSKVTFYHPGKYLATYQGVKSSGSFYSSTKGQFNFFVYIDSMWYGTYCNG